MSRTVVLMSSTPTFDALVLEVGRGALEPEISPESPLVGELMKMTDMVPEYPAPDVLEVMEKIHGPRLDDEIVNDAASLAAPLPETNSIPLVEITDVKTAAEVDSDKELPTFILAPKRPAAKRAPRKRVPPKGPSGASPSADGTAR